MNIPPSFVQGFVDEMTRQKLIRQRQQTPPPSGGGSPAYGPSGGQLNRPQGHAPGIQPLAGPVFTPKPNTRPTPLPDYVVASGGSYVPPSQRPMPADHRMDEIEARRAAIPEARIGSVGEGQLGPSYRPGEIQVLPVDQRPVVTPMQTRTLEQGPGMAGSTVDPFVTEQNTRAVVATYQGTRIGEELGALATENERARARLSANTAELQQITANAQQPGHQSTTAELEREQLLRTQIQEDQDTLDQNAADSRDLGSGSPILGTLVGIASAPGEWGGGVAGDLGYWYANNQDDPSAAAAVVGFIAESPIGAVLSADGVGATDYLRWIKDHPTEVAHVQANGFTNEQGQQFTGGDALYNYYLSSQGIVGSVITQAIVDPTSYVGLTGILGRRLAGTTATRFLPEGAVGRRTAVGLLDESIPPAAAAEMGITASTPVNIAREPVRQAVRRNVGGIVMGPQTLLDEAADRAVGGVGRAIGSLLPDPWLEQPLAQQVAGIVDKYDNIFRNRNVARRQLAEGETSARPGVGPDEREFVDSSVPYSSSLLVPGITISDEEMLNPEIALQQRNDLVARQTQAYQTGDIMAAELLEGEIRRLDARASYPVSIPPPPPPTTPTRGINVPSQLPDQGTPALPAVAGPYAGVPVGEVAPVRPRDWNNRRMYWNGNEWVEADPTIAALPQGNLPPPPGPITELMGDYNDALRMGDQAGADAIARRIDEIEAEDAAEYDVTEWSDAFPSEPLDVEPPAPVAPRYATPDDVPIRDNPNYRRGTGPAEVGEGENTLVVDYDEGGKKFTIYGPDEYPQNLTRPAAVRMAQREVYRIETEGLGGAAREAPVDAVTGEDFLVRTELDDGTYGAFLPDDDTPLVTAETPEALEQAIIDLDADDLPTGQATLPTDKTQYRQFGVGRAKMVDAVLENADDYTERGLAPQVDAWLKWREDFVGEGELTEVTPPLQSVTDRAEESIVFGEMVGEAPPPQTLRNTADDAKKTVASQAELAVFGSDNQARAARKWFHRQVDPENPKLSRPLEGAVFDPELGVTVTTYEEAAQYLKALRQKVQDAPNASSGQTQLLAAGAPVDLPSFRDLYRAAGDRVSTGRRLKRARRDSFRSARAAAAARRRAPLAPGVTRTPILSDAEERLLDTRISDLGQVGRSDVTKDGKTVVRGRNEGDTATVRSVYDSAHDSALARGLTEEAAHQEGMKAVAARITTDFGLDNVTPNRFMRGVDTYTNYVTTMARYGTPIAGVRSIQTDMVGDFMQTFLTEGPVTAVEMIGKTLGYVRRGFKWGDTRAGEVAEGWGFDIASMQPRAGVVETEVAGAGPKSAVRKLFAPKFGKFNTDAKGSPNPGRGYASFVDWQRGINNQMEMGRRTGLKVSITDATLMREKRSFVSKISKHRRLSGVNITDDEMEATIADLGQRFSPDDVRLSMERLAQSKGATKEASAAFGERTGRDWANIRNTAADDAKRRVNKALFSYEFTNADVVARRFIPFHYWSSRAIPFYVETAIRNPAFALSYYRMAEGMAERAEAEGWPDSLKFMVSIWSGPMGYIFFADPVANMGLLGVTEMLFPNDFDDGKTSSLGRFLQRVTGRAGVGVTPAMTAMMGYMGLMGEDAYVLDFTGTRPIRNLIGAVMQVAASRFGDANLLGRPVDEVFMAGRAYASRWASKWIPGSQEIPATDPQAYPKQQIKNGMVDLLMQERGYTSQTQITEADQELLDMQFETQSGPLYEEAVVNYSNANLFREGLRVLTGRQSMRQEGQFNRQNQDRRTPPGGSYAEPGQQPTQLQAYETTANLNGRYGRTEGGLSLPEYDPYNDFTLTEGEKQFMELWQAETGEAYQAGDLERYKEAEQYTQTMLQTTPEAAPYVAGEMGYYNIGPEEDAPLLKQYNNIRFANPETGLVIISGREWGPKRLAALTFDERETLANAWLAERDTDGSARRTLKMREAWKDAHPEFALAREWGTEVDKAWEDQGGLAAYRQAVSRDNPNAARYFANQERLAREEVGPNATPEEYRSELDRRTTNTNAYLAVHGIRRTLDDPNPASTGDARTVPGPYDPRPPGVGGDEGSGGVGAGGGAAGANGSGGEQSSASNRAIWITETVAASQAGIAQANAMLSEQLGYPFQLDQLPKELQDAYLAMLPPGLIPEDAWLYFDYLAWSAHQELMGGPTDLPSYIAATSNNREWRAQRTTSQVGGAEMVGMTPAQTYYGPGPTGADPLAQPANIPGGSYAAYLAGA